VLVVAWRSSATPPLFLEKHKMEAIVTLVGANRKQFVRIIRNEDGTEKSRAQFMAGEPVIADDETLFAIEGDLGHAIMACTPNANGVYKASLEATEALKKDIRLWRSREGGAGDAATQATDKPPEEKRETKPKKRRGTKARQEILDSAVPEDE